MNGRYLLDTNVIIALLAGETGVGSGLATAGEVFFPSTGI